MTETALSVQNLNKHFGKKQTLFDVNFECHKGHVVGLVGVNGAGKTTIMKSILSLLRSEGEIKIYGEKCSFDDHKILSDVGALIEYPGIYPFMSGRDHLRTFTYPTSDKEQKIQDIIKELRLTDYIDRRAKKYSLGMKQKLGIAMALVNDPKLVILDEPMNGLDPQATKDLRELILKKKREGVTFLISSHILAELQKLAEDLIVIDHGRVIKETTMKELLADNQHFVILSTSDDEKSAEILHNSGYELVSSSPLKIVFGKEDKIENIMGLIMDKGINIKDLRHEDADLENSILELIAE